MRAFLITFAMVVVAGGLVVLMAYGGGHPMPS
jgi:hypothetical protein